LTNKKDMSFIEAYNKYNINLLGDADNDKILNFMDCKPLDPNRDGLFGRIVNIVSMGKYGQSKEDYDLERTSTTSFERDKSGKVFRTYRDGKEFNPFEKSTNQLLDEYKQRQYKLDIEKQKEINDIIKQKIELEKLKNKNREMQLKKQLESYRYPKPSTSQQAVAMFMGVSPQPSLMLPQRHGYEIIPKNNVPKLPKGFKWKKTSKSKKNKSSSVMSCPRCTGPLMMVPGPFGQPVMFCPKCNALI